MSTSQHKPRGNHKPPVDGVHQAASASAKFKPERAAVVLVEALYIGDSKAARKFDVSLPTIRSWRARLSSDQTFSDIFEQRRLTAEKGWAEDVGETLRMYRAFIRESAREGDYTPEMVTAMTVAGQALQEAAFRQELLDARVTLIKEKLRVLGERNDMKAICQP